MKHYLLTLLLLSALICTAQLTEDQTQKIDEIFQEWNRPNHPGGVVGIQQEGKIVYQKAFGLASMEYLVPNQKSTVFNIASVSKQFTAMGILMLEKQKKLSVDDDLKKHIPELPDFGETITIRHLLHHTSGIRSFHAILQFAGWRGNDYRNNDDIYRLMEKQQDLNFPPGSEYMYCNTGYIYMGRIIEQITGENFTTWMRQNIFDPLDMPDTYVEDNPARIVPENATSYYGNADRGFERAVEYWAYVGSGNMHSTVNDLLAWSGNFYNPKPGWEDLFKRLETLDPFTDGTPNNYAFGVTINHLSGMKTVGHGGAIGGFRSNLMAVPEKKTSIVILTNFSAGNPGGKSNDILDVLIDFQPKANADSRNDSFKTVRLAIDKLRKFERAYWNSREKYGRKIVLQNDTLRYVRGMENQNPIVPIGKNEFRMVGIEPTDLRVIFDEQKGTMTVTVDGGSPSVFNSYQEIEESRKELDEYVGRYYSPELEVNYDILWRDDKLHVYHQRHGYMELNRLLKDVLESDSFVAEIQRDQSGKVNGMLLSGGRVRNLRLVRVD